MKDTIYFRHDYDSQNDPKMMRLIASPCGWTGYGLFWATLECMRGESEVVIYEKDLDAFAFRLHYERIAYAELLHFWVELGLLVYDPDDKLYFSERLQQDTEHMRNKSKKAKHSADTRWKARSNANALPTHSERNAIKERKGKDKKEKESIVNEIIFENFSLNKIFYDFIDMRNKNKKTVTDLAKKLLVNKLNSMSSDDLIKIRIVENAIMNGRQSFYELKDNNGQKINGTVSTEGEADMTV